MKVLVLYTRLPDYWMACMQHSRDRDKTEFLVFRSSPHPDAPFEIKSETGIEIHDREAISANKMEQQIATFSPDIIYVAGWTNKTYLSIAKAYKKKGIPVITGMDNHWKGTVKQYLAGLLSPWLIKPYFTDIWIPGSPQYRLAKHLGFSDRMIHTGLYCANSNLFKGTPKTKKKSDFLFIGRLVDHKGVPLFVEVLKRLIAKNQLDFTIHFVGNGPLKDSIPVHQNIKHTPFVAPSDLPDLLHQAGFFILPSTYEAWGVVVHEALLTGTPVISTHQCGAAKDLVTNDVNGYLFDASKFEVLEEILSKIENLSHQEYAKLSENALAAGNQINHDAWSQTLMNVGKRK